MNALSLEEVTSLAGLQTRTDRKYVVDRALFASLTGALAPDLAALEIDGRRSFRYESVYFDTPALDSYYGAARGRRLRFKVRTRAYLDSGDCALEVKTRSGRGETVKDRMQYALADRHRLTPEGLAFVAGHVRLADGSSLSPALTTSYRRSTLVDLPTGSRITCDAGLVCMSGDGSSVSLPDRLLVETKSSGLPTTADRFLWRAGCRPTVISKFCVGLAALDPGLPANRWNLTLRRYFGWSPVTDSRARPPMGAAPRAAGAAR